METRTLSLSHSVADTPSLGSTRGSVTRRQRIVTPSSSGVGDGRGSVTSRPRTTSSSSFHTSSRPVTAAPSTSKSARPSSLSHTSTPHRRSSSRLFPPDRSAFMDEFARRVEREKELQRMGEELKREGSGPGSSTSRSISRKRITRTATTTSAPTTSAAVAAVIGRSSSSSSSSSSTPSYSSSRLAYLPVEIVRVTAESRSAQNLLKPGKKTCWSTGSGLNHEIVLTITSPCLLGYVKLLNRSVSHVEIYMAMHDVPSQYVKVHHDLHCPHNKSVMYPVGFLPCRYVKIKCVRGTPIALFNVSLIGVLERVVWREMGPVVGDLLVSHPEALFLPAKPRTQPHEKRTFPAYQDIKEVEEEKKEPIRKIIRQ